jgi:transcriptional regulator with XRE-family HTH domain
MPPSSRSPQPAKAVLALRGITNAQIARDLGYTEHWVGRVLNGREKVSDEFVDRLGQYLGEDVSGLFVTDPENIVLEFVRKTTEASGVPLQLEEPGAVERVARALTRSQEADRAS